MEPDDGQHWIIRQSNGAVHCHPFEPRRPPVILLFTSERKAQEYLDSCANCWNCDPAQVGTIVAMSVSETRDLLRACLRSERLYLDPASPYPSHAEYKSFTVFEFLVRLLKWSAERQTPSRIDETWN